MFSKIFLNDSIITYARSPRWSPSSKPAEKYFPAAASTTSFTSRWLSSDSSVALSSSMRSIDSTLAGGRFSVMRTTPLPPATCRKRAAAGRGV
jgi:hypothetical protein